MHNVMLAGISGDSCEEISIALLNCILDLIFILVYIMFLPVLEVIKSIFVIKFGNLEHGLQSNIRLQES